MIGAFRKFVAPVARRALMGVAPVAINLVDDSTDHQQMQVEGLADEVLDDLPHLQPYGFASHAKVGAVGMLLSVLGVRAQGVILNVGDYRYRLKGLSEGEVAIYDDQGQTVKIGRDGIEVTSSKKFTVNVQGDATINSQGDVAVTAAGDASVTAAGDNTVKGTRVIIDSSNILLGGTGATKKVALDGDAVSGSVVHASSTTVKAL